MSKIEDLSIFGVYDQRENRVTAALLHVFQKGGPDIIRYVISSIEEVDFPTNEISIVTQEKEVNNVYDGKLECNFSFRVIVESKIVKQMIPKNQLEGLLNNAKSVYDYILYITPDENKPKILNSYEQKIYWTNWKNINDVLIEFIHEDTDNKVLEYLILEFEKLLDTLNLLEVDNPEKRVQIAAGSWGEPVALKYKLYACQNNRTIKPSGYLAFYNDRRINYLFKIKGEPINDCDLTTLSDVNVKLYLTEMEPNYQKGELRQFYSLELVKENLNIKHLGITKSGKNSAFTMGVFRYTSLDKISTAINTFDL